MIVLELMFVSFRMIGNLMDKSANSIYSVPFQWTISVAIVCQACFGTSCGISITSCWRVDVPGTAHTL